MFLRVDLACFCFELCWVCLLCFVLVCLRLISMAGLALRLTFVLWYIIGGFVCCAICWLFWFVCVIILPADCCFGCYLLVLV